MNKKKFRASVSHQDIIEGEACQYACPLHIDMPAYYDLMRKGDYESAYVLLKSANPFPAITGRVCLHPCDYACIRGCIDLPVAIREVESFLANRIQQGPNPRHDLSIYKEGSKIGSRSEEIAIIGSGPAGMIAAWDLAHFGYNVTMYEKRDMLGGMAHLGVPAFKIIREEINYEFEVLKKIGVQMRTGVEVGTDIRIDELISNGSKAVCIAIGADVGRYLPLSVEVKSDRIFDAIWVLRQTRLGRGKTIKLGDSVIIVGGGNTAIDVARTCRRLGSKNVIVLYRRTRDRMPADKIEVNAAELEGVKFKFLSIPARGKIENHKLIGLVCKKVNADKLGPGRSGVIEAIDGSEFLIESDSIIRAISEKPDLSVLGEEYSEKIVIDGLIRKDMESGAEDVPGIFAAGDVISGPHSIVAAMASGRRAAENINKHMLNNDLFVKNSPKTVNTLHTNVPRDIEQLKRQPSHQRKPLKIEGDFGLLSEPFTEQQALQESERCLRCNHNIEIDSKGCILCRCCVDICPVKCLAMVTDKDRIIEDYNELQHDETGTAVMLKDKVCIRCGMCIKACPENVIEYKRFKFSID